MEIAYCWKFFVVNNPLARPLTAADIQNMIDNDRQQLTRRILRFGRQIRGTPQFWFSKRQELLSMVDQLGSSSLFFTFSVADHQWPDCTGF